MGSHARYSGATPDSMPRGHAWQCPGDPRGCQGSASTLPTGRSARSPKIFFLFFFFRTNCGTVVGCAWISEHPTAVHLVISAVRPAVREASGKTVGILPFAPGTVARRSDLGRGPREQPRAEDQGGHGLSPGASIRVQHAGAHAVFRTVGNPASARAGGQALWTRRA